MSQAALQLLQAFSLHKIAAQAYESHTREVQRKKQLQSRLSITSVMKVSGFPLAQLFGYHFQKQLEKPFLDIARDNKMVRVDYPTFHKLLTKLWVNMGEYSLFIPVIYNILTGYANSISLKDFAKYLEICKTNLTPFTAILKEHIQPSDMQKMIKEIEGTCEKEDLKMTGYVEKVIIVDIIKKYLGDKYAFQIDGALVQNDEVDYGKLMGEEYLRCGGRVRKYLNGFLIVKIVKVIKRMAAFKKRRRKKDAGIRKGKVDATKKKETKNQKILKQFIEQNKKDVKDDKKKYSTMIKSILYDCIFQAVEIKHRDDPQIKGQIVKKSIYTSEPMIVEHELRTNQGGVSKMYPGPGGTALFLSDNEGKIMHMMSGVIDQGFKIKPSAILKASPIADYIYYEDILFIIREDGLLFTWCSSSKSYKTMIQTQFRYHHKKLEDLNTKNILSVNHGFLLINCSQVSSSLIIFNLQLEMLGRVILKSQDYGLSPSILKESRQILKVVSAMKRDVFVSDRVDLQKRIRINYEYKDFLLMEYMFKKYQEISVGKIEDYAKWVGSYQWRNKILIDKGMAQRIRRKETSSQDFDYLMKYQYIQEPQNEHVSNFVQEYDLVEIAKEERRHYLPTLFQDNAVLQLEKSHLSRSQFSHWLQRCSLNSDQLSKVLDKIDFDLEGKLDLTNFIQSEQYLRTVSTRTNQFLKWQKYKLNELPPIVLSYVLPFFALDFVITIACFPAYSEVRIVSVEGTVINRIDLEIYSECKGKTTPIACFCSESGYVAFSYANTITLWNINKIMNKEVSPARIVKGLEPLEDPILALNFMYFSNTFATVTKGCVKFWDMEQILFSRQASQLTFSVKPGYKAIQKKRGGTLAQLKKKVLVRGKAQYMLALPTKYSNYFVAILSQGDRTSISYLKLFYLSKFKVVIPRSKLFEQIPRKLLRLLSQQAQKNKYSEKIQPISKLNQLELELPSAIQKDYKAKLNQNQSREAVHQESISLINKLSDYQRIYIQYEKIIEEKLFKNELKGINDKKMLRFNLLLKLFISDEIDNIFKKQFLNLYRDQEGKVEQERVIGDMFNWGDRVLLRRLLCICSLIWKYSRPYTCHYLTLISHDNSSVEAESVALLISQSQMSKNIINQSVSMLNSVKIAKPLEICSLIIDTLLPTEYRFPSVRYYKAISTHFASAPSDYFVCRFEYYTNEQLVKEIVSPKGYKDILEHIEKEKLIEKVQELSQNYQEILGDNMQLIDICMSHSLITEQQATFYFMHLPSNYFRNISGQELPKKMSSVNLDEIAEHLAYVISKKKVKIPKQLITYQWFYELLKEVIESDDKIYEIFYSRLKGSILEHTAYSTQLNHLLDLNKKFIAIQYYPLHWKQLLGSRVNPLIHHLAYFKQQLGHLKIMKGRMFSNMLHKVEDKNYDIITMRCAYASLNSTHYPNNLNEDEAAKEYKEMYVNTEHFIYFLEAIRKERETQPSPRVDNSPRQLALQFKIPNFTMINQLAKSTILLSHAQIIELLSFNTQNFTYRQLVDWTGSLPFGKMKAKDGKQRRLCGVWQLKKILKIDMSMLGWMLLHKYGKINVLSKCLVIDGMIQISQLNQIFLSQAIFRLVLEGSHELMQYKGTFPVDRLEQIVERDIIRPSLDNICHVFSHSIIPHAKNINSLVFSVQKKDEIEIDKFVKYFLTKNDVKQSTVKIVLSHIIGNNNRRVNLKQSMNKIYESLKGVETNDEIKKWAEKVREGEDSLVSVIGRVVQPHQVAIKQEINGDAYSVTREHVNQLIGKELPWTYSYSPCFTFPHFLEYLHSTLANEENLNLFVNNCLIKLGLHHFYHSLQSKSFSDFYAKCKSTSAVCKRMTAIELSRVYDDVSSGQGTELGKLFSEFQLRIFPEERIGWIIEFKEKLGMEQTDLSYLRVNNLVYNEDNSGEELKAIQSQLCYEEYLIRKYCKSSNKLAHLLSQLENIDYIQEQLMELGLSADQISLLGAFFRNSGEDCLNRYREEESKSTNELSFKDEQILLEEITKFIDFFKSKSSSMDIAFNCNYPIKEQEWLSSQIFNRMCRDITPEWSCLRSYINLYHYCEHILIDKIFKKQEYRQIIVEQFRRTIGRCSLNMKQVYQIFNLSYGQTFTRYMPFFVAGKVEHHSLSDKIYQKTRKYLLKSFVKYNHNAQQLKFPLNFNTFNELFSQEIKGSEQKVDHGQIFKKLNIWGCGYVNINDVPQYKKLKLENPYININTFIDLHYPKAKKWRSINPPQEIVSNRDFLVEQLVASEEVSSNKVKIISRDNLFRVMGYCLTEEHRLFIQHRFRSGDAFDLVKVVRWIGAEGEEEEKGYEVLDKLVEWIQQKGGVYNILRDYEKQVILTQRIDCQQQRQAYLESLLVETNPMQIFDVKAMIKKIAHSQKIKTHLPPSSQPTQKIQNKLWLQQILLAVVDTYNNQIRQWSNYNNKLVHFLNELPLGQFSLLEKMYQANCGWSKHRIFDVLAAGDDHFTFSGFWVYCSSADQAYPFGKDQVESVYSIIDVNSDGNISYQEFCRFWSAVEQIFVPFQPPQPTPIHSMKQQIITHFLAILEPCFEKGQHSDSYHLDLTTLETITNIRNKQKLQKLVSIISPEQVFRAKIDVHKLKVLVRQYKGKKARERARGVKQHNYLARVFGNNLLEFMAGKESVQFYLQKWLYFTYPTFGQLLTQYCYDQFCWDKAKITAWINAHIPHGLQQKQKKIKPIAVNQNIQPRNLQLFSVIQQLPAIFQQFYKKYCRKISHLKHYGSSVSYRLHFKQVVQSYELLMREMGQMIYFVDTVGGDEQKLMYQFQEDKEWRFRADGGELHLKRLRFAAKEVVFREKVAEFKINSNIECAFWRNDEAIRSEHVLRNMELRGKSGNRFSLTSNKQLYKDPLISGSFCDQQLSTSNMLVIYSQFSTFKPLMDLNISKNNKLASILTMVKLAEMALYMQKKYKLIGLLVNPCDLCLDYEGERQFKMTKFYGGIKLDDEGSYLEGISPLELFHKNEMLIVPPETYENIYTQNYDSYCLAYILFYLYSGQFIRDGERKQSLEESVWFGYSELHNRCRLSLQLLAQEQKNPDIEAETVFMTLLYECTHYQWHQRPRMHQIVKILHNLVLMSDSLQNIGKELIIKPSVHQYCVEAIQLDNFQVFAQMVNKNRQYAWSIDEVIQIREMMPQQARYFTIYNQLLKSVFDSLEESNTTDQIGKFLTNMVDYVCQSTKKATLYLSLQIYNSVISSSQLKPYLSYCDQEWKISQFNVQDKLKQLNMQNRIFTLPKSSLYYLDISTLNEARMTLYLSGEDAKKRSNSTKKIALTFVESCLLSNNVNKISAALRSNVVRELYRFLEDRELGQIVLRIYLLITSCLNPQLRLPMRRSVEEGYKVMMVMHNTLSLYQPAKKGETVVDMLTFMNNYYNFYGQECKTVVLRQICKEQVCTLPTLTFLFNLKIEHTQLLYRLLVDLSYDERYYRMLNLVTVSGYGCMREMRKNAKYVGYFQTIQKLIKYYQADISLRELSVQTSFIENKMSMMARGGMADLAPSLLQLMQKHMVYFKKKSQSKSKPLQIQYLNNYYQHFSYFLEFVRKIAKDQFQNSYSSKVSCSIVENVFKLHLEMMELWCEEIDVVRYFIEMAEKIYEREMYYQQNAVIQTWERVLFDVILRLLVRDRAQMVRLGFVHFFLRVTKRQHQLIQLYISKKVENIQLKNSYSDQAEFKLNVLNLLLNPYNEEIHRILVVIGFGKYLVEDMLASAMTLDLRYYKGNFDVVPFRFCRPLRAEAIIMLSIILPISQSSIRAQVVSRLLPITLTEKAKLQELQDTAQSKMRFVETLWLFGHLLDCNEERLRYELLNNGSYNMLNNLLQKYPLLSSFFPRMNETIKTGALLKTSAVFSRFIDKTSA